MKNPNFKMIFISFIIILLVVNLSVFMYFDSKDKSNPRRENISNSPTYNIPMGKEYQDYIYTECMSYDLSYEMVLGIIYADGRQNDNIFILSEDVISVAIDELEIKNYDKNDKYQNIDIGLYYIYELKSYFGKTMPDEYVFGEMLLAYKNGIEFVKTKNVQDSYEDKYVIKVLDYKTQLETTGTIKEVK